MWIIAVILVILPLIFLITKKDNNRKLFKIFIMLALSIAMIIALLMTACGFIFTFNGDMLLGLFLLSSIILGIIWFVFSLYRLIKRIKKY